MLSLRYRIQFDDPKKEQSALAYLEAMDADRDLQTIGAIRNWLQRLLPGIRHLENPSKKAENLLREDLSCFGSMITNLRASYGEHPFEELVDRAYDDVGDIPISKLLEMKPRQAKSCTTKPSKASKEPTLTAALLKHHGYKDGSVMNWAPIGSNELAKVAVVGKATANAFFMKWFETHAKYRVACQNEQVRITLMQLAGEPLLKTYGRDPEEHETDS